MNKFKKNKTTIPQKEIQEAPNFTPQYKVLGVSPTSLSDFKLPPDFKVAKPTQDHPRAHFPSSVRQPYAEPGEIPNMKNIPNVGNNTEHQWSLVDGIIDDVGLDPHHSMIDNNDYVYAGNSTSQPAKTIALDDSMFSLKDKEYLLFIKQEPFCSGSFEEIENQAKLLIFGDHPDFKESFSEGDIFIIKRVSLKVGVFCED